MEPHYEISYTMIWRDSAEDDDVLESDEGKVQIEVEFDYFNQFSDSGPMPVSRIRKSYIQPRIFLSLHGIKQCIIRNALVSTLGKVIGFIEYDLHIQQLIDDITPRAASFASEFLDDPSNFNVQGITLSIKIVRTDVFDDVLRESEKAV